MDAKEEGMLMRDNSVHMCMHGPVFNLGCSGNPHLSQKWRWEIKRKVDSGDGRQDTIAEPRRREVWVGAWGSI